MIIRRMVKEDLVEATSVFIDAYAKSPWNETWKYSSALQRISDVFFSKNSICAVCEKDNHVIGAILCLKMPWTIGVQLEIREFFVDTKSQNQSIGTELIKFVPTLICENQPLEIVLSTKKDLRLMHFYNKNKFSNVDDLVFYSKCIR